MSGAGTGKNVFTIAPGAPFLSRFVAAFLAGDIVAGFPADADPFTLSRARIFVPTRRAARALAGEFAAQLGKPVALLPQIVPLGAMDESETAALFDIDSPAVGRADVVSDVARRLALARLILRWGAAIREAIRFVDGGAMVTIPGESILVTAAPAQAWHLAGELAALIDEMTIEDIDRSKLRTLVPDAYDKYWAITLQFLDIALKAWPDELVERGLEDRATRQAELVVEEIARLRAGRADGDAARAPQIVIGSTGTNAATAKLIAAIAALPDGAVVLPGLDKELDGEGWNAIAGDKDECEPAAGHPQAALQRLLTTIGIAREDVRELAVAEPAIGVRMRLLREALRPAETTDRWIAWRGAQGNGDAMLAVALENVALVEADDERQEALAIAVALREALEEPGKTAALITPDRTLARRVRAELQRWSVEVDDSGGDPLALKPAGVLARLALDCAIGEALPSAVMALLDHADVRLGFPCEDFARLRKLAEVAVLRGLVRDVSDPARAIELASAAANEPHAHRAKREIPNVDWERLRELLERFYAALAPLRGQRGQAPVSRWFALHRECLILLRATHAQENAPNARDDDDALETVFDDYMTCDDAGLELDGPGYAALFAAVVRETIVRGPQRAHPRIKILGLLEARLMPAQLKILGGLDEAIWPPAAQTGAFLNRPMRAGLGMSSPERRIGQTAHDFVEAMGAHEVILTRARKREGAPTVPSRFIQRMSALAGDPWRSCVERGRRYLQLAAMLDEPQMAGQIAQRPRPKPPLALRPVSLSVTEIETWRRDPYAIYARHILKLEPLEELDRQEGPAEFGSALHEVLAEYHQWRESAPAGAGGTEMILQIAQSKCATQLLEPAFAAFKWPKLCDFLHGYVAWDEERRASGVRILAEQYGVMDIQLADGSVFKLRGRADRFEIDAAGNVVIIDFKTGAPQTAKVVAAGFAPQLPLEAAMISHGAFADAQRDAHLADALYVKIGSDEEVAPKSAVAKGKTLAGLAQEHLDGLKQMAEQFRDPQTPYLPRPWPQYINRFGVYDHLARVKEWSSGGGGDS